jgi:hypothetical protein
MCEMIDIFKSQQKFNVLQYKINDNVWKEIELLISRIKELEREIEELKKEKEGAQK